MTAGFGGGTARQIANAHTIFNVSLAFIFLPFTVAASKVIHKILPDKKEETGLRPAVWYLDEATLGTPAMAIDLARTEIARMLKIMGRMLSAVIYPFISEEPRGDEIYPKISLIEGIEMRENKMNFLEHKVKEYLIRISRNEVTNQQASEVAGLISMVKDLESAADIIHRDILPLVAKKRALDADFSEEGRQEILDYHGKMCKQIDRLKESFAETDLERARRILEKESEYFDLNTRYRTQHLERLLDDRQSTFHTHEVHMELMDYLKQINIYASNMAKTVVEMGGKT
jgi:phosphate:Na+ symporter